MDPKRWAQVQELFEAVVERPSSEQVEWLDAACSDEGIKQEALSLLAAATDDRLGGIVGGAATATLQRSEDQMIGASIGSYRVVRELGSGGMGVVYLAERDDDEFDQRVAIKVVRERLVGDELIQRFRYERQILARLDHLNIARLLDGGTTDEGLPYVVMEFVEGVSIDRYCESHALAVEQRLELFLGICDAVHDAHQNLIVHRDIKPSNVLVSASGVPKLLDFGIARLLDTEQPNEPLTRTGFRAMTPAYASPEQMRGESVTTATDVYSLGVLLYELLAGRRPFGDGNSSAAEMERLVCDTDPARLTTLKRELSRDLENIVMMALRKEPHRRYASVYDLAEDIRRHLSGHPVNARPATWSYRTGRFITRNRALSAALVTIALLLIVSSVGATVLAMRAKRAMLRANEQAAVTSAVNEFLNVDLLAQADPYEESDREISLRAVVDRASEKVEGRFEGQPLVEAGVRRTLANTYVNLGELALAEAHYRRSAELLESHLGAANEQTLASWNGVVDVLYQKGAYDEAEQLLKRMRPSVERGLEPTHPIALSWMDNLAEVYDGQGRFDEAIEMSGLAVAAYRDALGDDDPSTLTAISNLGLLLEDRDRFDESEPLLLEVLEARRRTLGNENPDTLLSMSSLGFHYVLVDDHERAEPLLREAVDRGRSVLGQDHHWQQNHEGLLADLYRRVGRNDDAERIYLSVLERQRLSLGDESPFTLRTLLGIASIYARQGRVAESEEAYGEVIRQRETLYGEFHPATSSARRSLSAALRNADRCPRVVSAIAPFAVRMVEVEPEPNRFSGAMLVDYAACLVELGRVGEAGLSLRLGASHLVASLGEEHEEVLAAQELLRSQEK